MLPLEPRLLKVSALQPALKRYDREYNISKCCQMAQEEAEKEKPHFICLPNYFFQKGIEEIPGPALIPLKQISKRYDVYIYCRRKRKTL